MHYRVIPAANKGMAAQKTAHRHPTSAQRAVTLDRLHRVLRASRDVAASRREQGRNSPLVSSQELQHDEFGEVVHASLIQAFGSRLPELLFSAASDLSPDLPASF